MLWISQSKVTDAHGALCSFKLNAHGAHHSLRLTRLVNSDKSIVMFEANDYRQILRHELERRCKKNPRYSLRAFARDLELSSARLSEVLNSKSGISRERASEIAQRLGFNSEENEFFCNLVESKHARSAVRKQLAQARLLKYLQANEYHSLQVDHFNVISEWYHAAIIELIHVNGFQSDPRWVANRLGILEIEAKLALERLERLGLIRFEYRKYRVNEEFVSVKSATPSEAIRKFHRQILEKALESVDFQSIEQRELGATVMAVSRDDLPKMKEKIRAFRKELNVEFGNAEKKNAVFCFGTQLFEMTKTEEKSK